ncbi:MAG: MATE family efflux transporter [Actinomycetota bacterium]
MTARRALLARPGDRSGPHRALWALTYPLIVGNLAAVALSVTDGAVLGRFSTDALAAVGLAAPVMLVATILATGWATAVQVMTARRHGAGEAAATERALDIGAAVGLAVGAVVGAALAAIASPLMNALAGDTDLAPAAASYLRVVAVALPLLGAMTALRSALAGMGLTKVTMRAAIGVNLVNIPVTMVLVLGLGLGVVGAAVGTVSAVACGFTALAWYGWRRLPASGHWRRPRPQGWTTEVARMWRIGWPETAMLSAGYLTSVLLAAIVARLGVVDLAAWSILGRALPVLWTVIYACSSGIAIMVGQRLGAGDPEGVGSALRSGWVVTGWLAAAIVAPVVAVPDLVFGVFTDDGAVAGQAVAARLYLFGQAPLMVATMVYSGALRAGGDTRSIMVASTVANYLCALPLSWALAIPLGLGLPGVFGGQLGYWVLRLAITHRSFARGRWRTASL